MARTQSFLAKTKTTRLAIKPLSIKAVLGIFNNESNLEDVSTKVIHQSPAMRFVTLRILRD
jgi:hypothetical protein